MKYTHVYSGTDGLTHFKDVDLPGTRDKSFRLTSEIIKATGVFFRETEGKYNNEYHNTPRRMFVVVLEGGLEIIASDGTKRTFGPGDVFLEDDPTGKGHYTQPLDGKPRRTLFITLD
jgi:hypothetical protein